MALQEAVLEFLECSIHSILYVRGIYPISLFEQRQYLGVSVWQARHPEINAYIRRVIDNARPLFAQGLVDRVVMVTKTEGGNVIDHISIKCGSTIMSLSSTNGTYMGRPGENNYRNRNSSEVDMSTVYEELRSSALRIGLLDTQLPKLPEDCTWSVMVVTNASHANEAGDSVLQATLSSGEWYVDNNQLAEQLSLAQRSSDTAYPSANNGRDSNNTSSHSATSSSSGSTTKAPKLVPIKSFQNELVNLSKESQFPIAMEGETLPDELEEQVLDQIEAEEQQEEENIVDEDAEAPSEVPPLTGETTPQETQATTVDSDEPSSTAQDGANKTASSDVGSTPAVDASQTAESAAAADGATGSPTMIAETKKEISNAKLAEPVVEEVKRDPNLVSVTLRAVDNGWVMGVDWIVDFHNLMTMGEIRTYVEQHRGISRHRIQLRLKGKVLPANREIWTLRRMGIYDGYTILIEPTLTGSWLWEPKEYYVNKLLDEVCEIVTNTVTPNGSGRINLKVLNEKIKPPPCIKTSLRVFLRQYPERIYIHTDTNDNELWVHVTKRPFQLPTFGTFSVEIGTFPYYKPKRYDWAGNKDIDDMYKIETLPEEEEEVVAAEGVEAAGVPQEALLSPEEAARQEAIVNEQNAREAALNDTESYANDSYLGEESYVTGDPE